MRASASPPVANNLYPTVHLRRLETSESLRIFQYHHLLVSPAHHAELQYATNLHTVQLLRALGELFSNESVYFGYLIFVFIVFKITGLIGLKLLTQTFPALH